MRRGYGRRRMMAHWMCQGWQDEPSVEDKIGWLEEYQRDLEQETADVAERIRRLKERRDQEHTEPTVQV